MAYISTIYIYIYTHMCVCVYVSVYTSTENKMRFGRCSELITLPHLACISEA